MIDAGALNHPFVFFWYMRATGQKVDSTKYSVAYEECKRCAEFDEVHDARCPNHPDYDPTPYCIPCGARTADRCTCLPIAHNN